MAARRCRPRSRRIWRDSTRCGSVALSCWLRDNFQIQLSKFHTVCGSVCPAVSLQHLGYLSRIRRDATTVHSCKRVHHNRVSDLSAPWSSVLMSILVACLLVGAGLSCGCRLRNLQRRSRGLETGGVPLMRLCPRLLRASCQYGFWTSVTAIREIWVRSKQACMSSVPACKF